MQFISINWKRNKFGSQNKFVRILALTLLCTQALLAEAQVSADIPGAQDLPLVGRYPGSLISSSEYSEYDEFTFPKKLNSRSAKSEFEKLDVAGERRVLVYDVPPSVETNTLKIFRSLEKSLNEQIGFTQYISCSGENSGCGFFFPRTVISKASLNAYYKNRFREFSNLHNGRLHIYSGSLDKDGFTYYLFLVVAQSKYSSFIQYSVDLLKVANLKTKDIVLTDDYMDAEIQKKGKVVLDGLFFDHNSAHLNDKSKGSLTTIASFIKKRPEKKYMVVGHTDTEGGYAYNLKLSQERADAVMDSLVDQYSVPKTKLKAVGVSYVSPADTNNSEFGRENNRRVELVEVNHF